MRLLFLIFFLITNIQAFAQIVRISGIIVNQDGDPVEGVAIRVSDSDKGAIANSAGEFGLNLSPGNYKVIFSHINYKERIEKLNASEDKFITVVLEEKFTTLEQVEIVGDREGQIRSQVSVSKIEPNAIKDLPTPFGEFNKILSTLPGVVAQNEFSSAYMVRGGNYDENLVYVNGITVYRPFLARAGWQEGLSFVNVDMIESVEFSSGGWQPRYGDKLASNLVVRYKKPDEFKASATAGLLGGAAHVEGRIKGAGIRYAAAARHKRWKYLLNTLETSGRYQPSFTDAQAFINFDLDHKNGANKKSGSEIDLLLSYARNRYFTIPENRETTIGNLMEGFIRLYIGFEGKEVMEYDTWQAGGKFTHSFSPVVKNELIVSGFKTREREYFDIEGGYRLCDVDKEIGSESFDKCIALRGIGTQYHHGRNRLEANLINIEDQLTLMTGNAGKLEAGVGLSHTVIDDFLQEYAFLDSADYVTVDESISARQSISYNNLSGYIQHSMDFREHSVAFGVRFLYTGYGNWLLASPRFQYAYRPGWNSDWVFKLATGIYRQPPFYREFRDREGQLHKGLKPQSSVHVIAGADHNLKIWGRAFKFIGEAYYKYLYHVIPYEVDNIRIRYLPGLEAKAYATGLDLRLSGEYVPGTESWLSIGFLTTREDIKNDGKGYLRRPSDQRLTASIFFEDHFANDPTMRMNLNVQFGAGLPFGPPGRVDQRTSFSGDFYERVDIGFSKLLSHKKREGKLFSRFWVAVEILNLFANENIASYTWIKDFNSRQYAVPNALSNRFVNLKLTVN